MRKGTCFLLDQFIQLNSREVIQDSFAHENYSSLIQELLMQNMRLYSRKGRNKVNMNVIKKGNKHHSRG